MQEADLLGLLDSLTETGVYVITEDTHEILYYNKRVQEVTPDIALGMVCHELWQNECSNCPLLTIGEQASNHTIRYNDPFGSIVDIMANRMLWAGHIPAFAIMVTPHQLNFEEEQGAKRIEQLYAQSLVTVFDECVIVNLTEDYYVNCQSDGQHTEIPRRGNYDEENARYARLVVHPEDMAEFEVSFSRQALLGQFEQGRRQVSKRLRRRMKNDAYHMAEFCAVRLQQPDDEDCWCVCIFRDVHEDYLQERQRNLEMAQLATAARGAYQMLISANLTKNTYYMMAYEHFRTKKAAESGCFDELISVGASTVDPDFREEFVRKFSRESLLAAFASGVQSVVMEMRQMGDDGQYHWNSTQVVKVEDPYSDDVIEITMTKNIDEERRQQEAQLVQEKAGKQLLEEALQKAEAASRAKSDFLSRMSHDIRTPMNAIMGLTTLAQNHLQEPQRLAEYLDNIALSGEHLLGLINEVLDVSRIESGSMRLEEAAFDWRVLLEEVAAMLQPAVRRRQQRLTLDIQPGLETAVLGDEQRLRQVLVNLLDNASKYAGDGGRIRIALAEEQEEADGMGTYQLVVEDNGIGMTQAYLAHIFEPFSRADDSRISKIAGTGLGLTIVHSIIGMMDGHIAVESAYGQGTRFTITLCLMKQEAAALAPQPAQTAGEQELWGMRVLLAEDNPLNQQIAAEMLGLLGAEVETADNGQEAVDMVLSRPPYYYELVFMDMQMPLVDGCEATRQIRRSGKEGVCELPIIAMTANAFAEDVKRTRLSGMDGHLAKPIDLFKLRQALTYALDRQRKNGREDIFSHQAGS